MSDKKTAFEEAAAEENRSLAGEFVDFLKNNKKFYLTPIIVVLLLMGLLIMLGGTAAAPFIYTLF
jgi:hypothetical protein